MANKIDKIIFACYAVLFGVLIFGVISPKAWVATSCLISFISFFISPSVKLAMKLYRRSKELVALSAANYVLAALYVSGAFGMGFLAYVAIGSAIAIATLIVGVKVGKAFISSYERMFVYPANGLDE